MLLTGGGLAAGCASSGKGAIPPPEGISDGIHPISERFEPELRRHFDRYAVVLSPSGLPIWLFAQAGVTDAQLLRAREVLRFFLADVPGSEFGADKSAVAEAMADKRAALVFFDDEESAARAFDGGVGLLDYFFQDLYATECVVEGSRDYLDRSVRDATYEEVFHLVHGAGIEGALQEYQEQLEAASEAAMESGIWEALPEWVFEGSTSHEYIISVIDVFYGLWAHDPDGDGRSFGGEYAFVRRSELEEGDPLGLEALRAFLPETLDYEVRLDPSFDGVFSIAAESRTKYASHACNLVNVRLTGDLSSGLVGNASDNVLVGNAGDNSIDGGAGEDIVVFTGDRSDYAVYSLGGELVVRDEVAGRDGTDTLRNVERLRFADEELSP